MVVIAARGVLNISKFIGQPKNVYFLLSLSHSNSLYIYILPIPTNLSKSWQTIQCVMCFNSKNIKKMHFCFVRLITRKKNSSEKKVRKI